MYTEKELESIKIIEDRIKKRSLIKFVDDKNFNIGKVKIY